MPMLSETYIGKYYEGDQVFSAWTRSIPGQDNDSYVILGESGYGKSVAAQSIMLQKAYQGHRILNLNIHNTSSSEHIFPIFRKAFNNCPHELMYTSRQFQQRSSIHYAMRMELRNHQQI